KGGKKAFYGVVYYYVNARSKIYNLPLALLQLASAYTGERIAKVINKTLQKFRIVTFYVSYFILNNATNNNIAINALA
ncbi:hypothetical protein K458DRAFT_314481, partial [Lentithecium fluviatile CBS 122367]